MINLFCFGLGYSARALLKGLENRRVKATARPGSETDVSAVETVPFDGNMPLPAHALDGMTHILVSIPPDEEGDRVVRHCGQALKQCETLRWVGYLSTTGVYGDRQGGWVDEESDLRPAGARGEGRVLAERQWLDLFSGDDGPSIQIFRLAGIYGPGRNQFRALRNGTARRIVKPGQVFSRIHVDDIAQVLSASIARPRHGGIYNVCDDQPAPPDEVVAYAAELLGMPPPPAILFDEADLSPMARSFYSESKRCRNDRIKRELGVALRYPSYREGLSAVLDFGDD